MRSRPVCTGAVLAALLAAGCGATRASPDPRRALTALLAELAAGDVGPVCQGLAPQAVSELATEFGGEGCRQTVGAAARYLTSSDSERRAVAAAKVLSALDLPLSPAPYYAGETSVRVRVQFDDPVLSRRQFIDVSMRFDHGRWVLSGGIAGLFTLLG
ncbi:MAG: hypothetical protein ACYDHH_25640 [Solirubrobacteraceae bacterium]